MGTEREPEEQFDRGLVVEGAPAGLGGPSWLVLLVLVAAAFAIGTGTGWGIGQSADASPLASAAMAASTQAPSPDPERWPWLEGKLPDSVAGIAAVKDSRRSYETDVNRQTAEALAAACGVGPRSVASAETTWPESGEVLWVRPEAVVFFVPDECPSDVLLDAVSENWEWAPIQIGDKAIRHLQGGPSVWLYARQQFLYVIRNSDLSWATEILSSLP